MRQIILDTETTGLDTKHGHRIIEIGCVELINRRLTGNNFHRYINPEREIDAGALSVHGISNAFLRDKPVFKKIADELLDYLNGAELIIHNAVFDLEFLNYEYQLLNKKSKKLEQQLSIIDTLIMARKLHPGQKNNLDALCKRYAVDNTKRNLHGALLDAEILAFVYLAMTGGQSSLFIDETQPVESSQNSRQEVKQLKTDRQPMLIVKAEAEELKAHQDYIVMLQKKSAGQCLWQNSSVES